MAHRTPHSKAKQVSDHVQRLGAAWGSRTSRASPRLGEGEGKVRGFGFRI